MGEISDISSRCYRAPILIVDRKRLELSTSSMPWRRATITLPARGPDRTRTDHLCNPPAMPVSVDLARIPACQRLLRSRWRAGNWRSLPSLLSGPWGNRTPVSAMRMRCITTVLTAPDENENNYTRNRNYCAEHWRIKRIPDGVG